MIEHHGHHRHSSKSLNIGAKVSFGAVRVVSPRERLHLPLLPLPYGVSGFDHAALIPPVIVPNRSAAATTMSAYRLEHRKMALFYFVSKTVKGQVLETEPALKPAATKLRTTPECSPLPQRIVGLQDQ